MSSDHTPSQEISESPDIIHSKDSGNSNPELDDNAYPDLSPVIVQKRKPDNLTVPEKVGNSKTHKPKKSDDDKSSIMPTDIRVEIEPDPIPKEKHKRKKSKKKSSAKKSAINLSQPADIEIAEKHGMVRLVYCIKDRDLNDLEGSNKNYDDSCPCCSLSIGQPFSLFCSVSELGPLGSSIQLYFSFVKYLIIALLGVFLIACIPCIVDNSLQDKFEEWTDQKSMNIITPGNYGFYDRNDVASWQVILHVIACGILLAFYPWVLRKTKETSTEIDSVQTTPSDFTLMVKGLPEDYTAEDIKAHIQEHFMHHKPEIINLVLAYDTNEYIECCKTLSEWEFKKEYVKKYTEKYGKPPTIKKCCKEIVLETEDQCTKKIEELEEKQKVIFKEMSTEKLAPVAFITFKSQITARSIEEEWSRSSAQIFFGKFLCCCCVNQRFKFNGNYIHAEMAPDHTDVNWENLAVTNSKKFFRRLLTLIAGFITLGIALAIIYSTANWKIEAYKNDEKKPVKIGAATVIPPMITVIVNFIVARSTRIYSAYEKHSTWSDFNLSVLNRITLFMLLNTLGIPILSYRSDEDWFCEGGLTYSVFWIEIMNAGIGPLIYLINPKNMIKKLKRRSLRKQNENGEVQASQLDANLAFEGPEVDMADRFANLIKTLSLSLFFAPIVPIGVLIGIFAIIIESCVFKFMLLRIHTKPRIHNSNLVLNAVQWMRWGILLYSLGILFFYYYISPGLRVLEWLFFLAVGTYVVTPFSSVFLCCYKDKTLELVKNLVNGKEGLDSYFKELPRFYSDYERENPITQAKGWKRWHMFMQATGDKENVYMSMKKDDKIDEGIINSAKNYITKQLMAQVLPSMDNNEILYENEVGFI